MTISNKYKRNRVATVFGVVVSIASLAVPCIVLGASRAGGLGVSSPARQQTHSRVFSRHGFFAAGGFPEVDATIEQSQPTLPIETEKVSKKGRYVQPRWVDGGYGVEVSEPGYWIDTENNTRR